MSNRHDITDEQFKKAAPRNLETLRHSGRHRDSHRLSDYPHHVLLDGRDSLMEQAQPPEPQRGF